MTSTQKILKQYKDGKISDTTIVKMAAFQDELEKTATDFAKTLGLMALAAPMFGLSQYYIGKKLDEHEDLKLEKEKDPSFKNMMNMHPGLRNEDQILVKKYFDSLWHFAPTIAQEPLAAGAYIRQAMQLEDAHGGPTYSMVKDLIQAEDKTPGGGDGPGEAIKGPMSSVFTSVI